MRRGPVTQLDIDLACRRLRHGYITDKRPLDTADLLQQLWNTLQSRDAALRRICDWNDGTPPLGDEPWLAMTEIARLELDTVPLPQAIEKEPDNGR